MWILSVSYQVWNILENSCGETKKRWGDKLHSGFDNDKKTATSFRGRLLKNYPVLKKMTE